MTNEQLLMLDSLVYFSKFSNDFTPKSDGTFYSVGDFVNAALANPDDYETCFNGALGYNDADLGMYDILGLVKEDSELMNLKIVYPQNADDVTTSSVCLVNSATNDVYVIFGGNYAQGNYQYGSTELNTWIENTMGATESNTDEQLRALDFYDASILAARAALDNLEDLNITVSGHSAAGNHSQYVTIAYERYAIEKGSYNEGNDIDRCVSVDGQGFSSDFLLEYQNEISECANKITSICPSVSIVGSLMNSIPGINEVFIDIGFIPDAALIGYHMPMELLDDEGNFKPTGAPSWLSNTLKVYSSSVVWIHENHPYLDADRAMNNIGHFLDCMFNNKPKEGFSYLCDADTIAMLGLLAFEIGVTIGVTVVFPELILGIVLGDIVFSAVNHFVDWIDDLGYAIVDFIYGGNELVGDDGDNTLYGNIFADFIYGKGGDDEIHGDDGDDMIFGGAGNDEVHGESGDDYIEGGAGNDYINGGVGSDELYGGAGNDHIDGGNGDDYIEGNDGIDVIYGDAGIDKVQGGDGNDELHGGADNDELYGEAGNDFLYGDTGADKLFGGNGNDELHGGEDGDELFGNEGDDTIHGDAGNDYIEGGNGNNHLYGDDGDDTIVTGEDTDYVYGGTGNDYVIGGNGDNYMYGEDGDDRLQGGEGYDYMEGGSGNDTLSGGNGFNEMYGQEGDDKIYGGDHADYIDGGVGDDQLYGGNGENEIYGREGNDTIYDGDDGSKIYGNEGNDSIRAGGGNDVIDGGLGDDYIQDDHGDDTVIFKAGYGTDIISDAAGNNTIELSGLSIEDAVMSRINGSDLKISFGSDNIIIKQYFDGAGFQNFNINGTMINDIITTLHGSDSDDWMSAWRDNGVTMNGEGGNDTLNGGNGEDVLDGGSGNDYLCGNNGDDTYIFGKGYGNDTIEDWGGSSIVKLTGINADEVTITNQNDSNLVLSVNGTNDTLVINGYKWNQGGYTFEFADGTTGTVNKDTWELRLGSDTSSGETDTDDNTGESGSDSSNTGGSNTEGENTPPDVDVSESYVVNGTDYDEWLNAENNNGGKIYAGNGNDGLSGGSGNDELYGGAGNDTLYGNDGDDILDGGAETDTLQGGNGNDTYVFGLGYGADTIEDWGGDSKVVFSDVTSDMISISMLYDSTLVISINGTEDTLTINNFKWTQSAFEFQFADGAIASVNKDTWELKFSKLPDIPETSEDDLVQENADILSEIYADNSLTSDILTETDNTVISDISDSVSVNEDSDEVSDQTDIQVMILTENMAVFADDSNISDSMKLDDITSDTAVMNQLFVGASVQ